MKKLIAGLIIVLLLGGILGIVPNMAYADPGGANPSGGAPITPPTGRGDTGAAVGNNGGAPITPPTGL
jgi:hypothetical protein